MTLKRNSDNKKENTLFLQLQKDMRKRNKREYIPVVVFQYPENMEIESYEKYLTKQKKAGIFSPMIKKSVYD